MINALFVNKRFNTYADTFLMLGLARIAAYALGQTRQKTEMQLMDEGTRYRIQFKKPVAMEAIAKLPYAEPFPPVCGQKTDQSKLPAETTPFKTVEHTEARRLYREYLFQNRGKAEWGEDTPPPPDPKTQNGVILTSMRHDRNHNDLWLQGWELQDKFGLLITSLLQAFSQENHSSLSAEFKLVADNFKRETGCKLPDQASAVKVFLPTAVQGVSRVKADGNKTDAQKADWLSLWLIANGLFNFGICERVKIAERVYDWRVTALEPQDIRFEKYHSILDDLRRFNPPGGGHGIARFDAELVLRFCLELLKNQAAQAKERPEDELELCHPPNHFVKGFVGTHFGQKGQVYGVKEVFTLGLPGWVHPENYGELQEYQTVLKEHLSVISSLSAEEGHSELLSAYRDFITGSELRKFFPFQVSYADYVIKRLADPKARPPRLFSLSGLNTMTKKDPLFTQITRDPSFLRIAKAINQATVFAGKVQTKAGVIELDWQRNYGLAQRLSSQSGSKKDFLSEITDFLAKYEAENLRLSEQLLKEGKPLKRVWTTKEDLDRLVELVEDFDTVLVANLLIAYGYARWTKAKDVEFEDETAAVSSEQDLSDLENSDNQGENNDD